MKRKIKKRTEEYYPNGQAKMVIQYKGNWDTGQFVLVKHFDYDEQGNLMKFKDEFERFEFLHTMHKKAINLDKKDYKNLWRCALAVRKMITVGSLDCSFTDGYKWATKYCTINGEKIEKYQKLKKAYEIAQQRGEEKVLDFEE
mgnify:CR=1 FL=1|tara:strand:- start:28 stop:456 length:429 start_codon:yes stop_codon:yes gene_type:complete